MYAALIVTHLALTGPAALRPFQASVQYGDSRDEASPSRSFAPRMPTSDAGAAPMDTATHDPTARAKRASAQNVSNIVALVRNGQHEDIDDVVSGLQHQRLAAPPPLDFFSPRPAHAAASSRPSSDDDRGASKVRGGSVSPSSPKRGVTSTPAPLASAVGDDGGAHAAPTAAEMAAQYPGHEGVVFTDPRTEVMTWRAADGTLGLLFRAQERDYADRYACAPSSVPPVVSSCSIGACGVLRIALLNVWLRAFSPGVTSCAVVDRPTATLIFTLTLQVAQVRQEAYQRLQRRLPALLLALHRQGL